MRLNGRVNGRNSLSPIDPEQLLQHLQLTTGKAAEFCDISRRQLCYWTDKGIVETIEGENDEVGEEGTRRVYDFNALWRVLLIKQLLEQGRGLKRATREVESYLQQVADNELLPEADRRTREELLQQQTQRMETLAEQIRSAVQRGRLSPLDLRHIAMHIHYFLELVAYDDSATLHLQEDTGVANQFGALIDQLALQVEEKVAEATMPARRVLR
jgi:DNA-binding transcriptional MerR regulator